MILDQMFSDVLRIFRGTSMISSLPVADWLMGVNICAEWLADENHFFTPGCKVCADQHIVVNLLQPLVDVNLPLGINTHFTPFRINNSQLPRCPDSKISRFPDTHIPRYTYSQMPRFPDAQFPRYQDFRMPRYPKTQTVPRYRRGSKKFVFWSVNQLSTYYRISSFHGDTYFVKIHILVQIRNSKLSRKMI